MHKIQGWHNATDLNGVTVGTGLGPITHLKGTAVFCMLLVFTFS